MTGFIDHVRLGVRDVGAFAASYGPLAEALGLVPEPRHDVGRAWGIAAEGGRMQWLILTPASREGAVDGLAPGLHHVAFAARDRAHVDRVHAALRAVGAEVIEAPCEYDAEPDHDAAFFRDPDGLKVEVVHVAG